MTNKLRHVDMEGATTTLHRKRSVLVAMVINSLAEGGAEKQLLLIVNGLVARGISCSVYWLEDRMVRERNSKLMDSAREAGAQFIPPRAGARFDWAQLIRLRRVVRQNPHAILWTWGYRADCLRLALLAVCGKPVASVVSLRSAYEARIRRMRWFWRIVARTGCVFISNSYRNVELLSLVASGIWRRAFVIYNAVEGCFFESTRCVRCRPEHLKIAMLGNLRIQIKGYDVAVELGVLFKDRKLPWSIIIGGCGPEEPELRQLIEEKGVGDVVHLQGAVEDPKAFLSNADVFLMLSRTEGMPNALLEAMAMGLPAVCTRVGDVPKFATDRENLWMVECDAESALVTLRDIWNDWSKAMRIGCAGRELCRGLFSEERMMSESIAVLHSLFAAEGRSEREAGDGLPRIG